ncbi:MAG: hypothetical protein APF84_03935 [Gracilibacter sp. BRH_c7a]|nr:MAG: hypothetical protein APF84_03935 [Gracilibacter sp. BRH_c7a]
MDYVLKESTDNLIRIYRHVYKDYKWKNSSNMNNLIALSHIMNEKEYSKQAIDRVNDYIKGKTGPFSCYRQKSILFSALLSLGFSDPEDKFDTLQDYEQRLKDAGFRSYTYRPVTAYTLLLTCEEVKIDERIFKAYEIFTEMRKDHPWLTSGDDYPLSVLLASSEDSVETIMKDIESLYYALNKVGLSRGNGLQFLSHILSLSPESNSEKSGRCRNLYDFFKQNKMKVYSTNYGALGLLTLLAERSQEAAQDVVAVSNYLRGDRSIRWLGQETLFLTATALVSTILLQSIQNTKALIEKNSCVTVEHLIAAQTAAMLGATCAATAVASNS